MKRIIRIVLTEDFDVPAEAREQMEPGQPVSGVAVTLEAEGFAQENLATPPHAVLHVLGKFLAVQKVPMESAQILIAGAVKECCDRAEQATDDAAERILREATKA